MAKIKPCKYCLTKIMKLSTIKVYYFNSPPIFFSESKKYCKMSHTRIYNVPLIQVMTKVKWRAL